MESRAHRYFSRRSIRCSLFTDRTQEQHVHTCPTAIERKMSTTCPTPAASLAYSPYVLRFSTPDLTGRNEQQTKRGNEESVKSPGKRRKRRRLPRGRQPSWHNCRATSNSDGFFFYSCSAAVVFPGHGMWSSSRERRLRVLASPRNAQHPTLSRRQLGGRSNGKCCVTPTSFFHERILPTSCEAPVLPR